MGQVELCGGALQQRVGLRSGAGGGLGAPDAQQVGDGEQPLLRAVVQVAPEPAALGVGRFDDPRARGREGGRLGAALELGRGTGGEDAQRRHVLVGDVHARGVEHGEVAEVAAVGAAQADGEVALQPHLGGLAVLGEAGA